MKHFLLMIFAVCALLVSGCTRQQLLVVTNAAAEACHVLEVVTTDGVVHGICFAVEALDRLDQELGAAQQLGIGVVLVVTHTNGSHEKLEVAPAHVSTLRLRVGALRR